jgi:hypothetical protein
LARLKEPAACSLDAGSGNPLQDRNKPHGSKSREVKIGEIEKSRVPVPVKRRWHHLMRKRFHDAE